MPDYRPFVNMARSLFPGIIAAKQLEYREGRDARLAGRPRRTHHARRRGAWFRGWDAADKDIEEAAEKGGG